MKQIDYLRLAATARKSSYYARPSDADEALKGLITYGATAAWIVTFLGAILAPYLGASLDLTIVSKPMVSIVGLAVALLICGLFVAGAPVLVRVLVAVLGAGTSVVILAFGIGGYLDAWYLFVPLFLFATVVSLAAVRQLQE